MKGLRQTVRVAMGTDNSRMTHELEMAAVVFGSLAVHVAVRSDWIFTDRAHRHVVTHIPTGRHLGRFFRASEARALAARLAERPAWQRFKGLPKTKRARVSLSKRLKADVDQVMAELGIRS